jgi:hypothetical protein
MDAIIDEVNDKLDAINGGSVCVSV